MGNCHVSVFLSTPPDQMKLPVPLLWLSRLAYYKAPDLQNVLVSFRFAPFWHDM